MTGYDDFFFKLFTTYGPLALGWLVWFLERRDHQKDTEKLIDLYAAGTATLAALKQLLDERLPKR